MAKRYARRTKRNPGRCDCGKWARHRIQVRLGLNGYNQKKTYCTLNLCEACYQLELQQAAMMTGDNRPCGLNPAVRVG